MYNELIKYLKENLSKERFEHTLEVANECNYYADVFSLSQEDRDLLYRCALLHDITKEKTPEEQCELCRVYNIEYDEAYLSTPALFHSLTGGVFAKEKFPELCRDKEAEIIKTHTTGCENMTLLQKLLFLADSTEPTRRHSSLVELRKLFHDNVTETNKYQLLDRAVLQSLDNTLINLIQRKKPVAQMTVKARNYLLKTARLQNE